MPEATDDLFTLNTLRGAVTAAFPELAAAPANLLTAGWDSVALEVGGFICKFPRNAKAEANLRREAGLLALVAPALSLPVPRLELIEDPRLFSRHRKLAGEHLPPAAYATLTEPQRQALAEALATFFAELHAIPVAAAIAAGARPLESWTAPGAILARVHPVLEPDERALAEEVLARFAALPPDPLGRVFGHFDVHGWNMAFDLRAGRLNGIYDFGDAGIGRPHGEFIHPGLIAFELVTRTIAAYEHATGSAVERERVAILIGTHRLFEVAHHRDDPADWPLAALRAWRAAGGISILG